MCCNNCFSSPDLVVGQVQPDVVGDAHVLSVALIPADEDGVGGGARERQQERVRARAQLVEQAGLGREERRQITRQA